MTINDANAMGVKQNEYWVNAIWRHICISLCEAFAYYACNNLPLATKPITIQTVISQMG